MSLELTLAQNDPINTLLVAPDGPLYEISTPNDQPGAATKIRRIEGEISTGYISTEVGVIRQHESQSTKLQVFATNLELVLHPLSSSGAENSWSFTGPDNRLYKWQIFLRSPVLIMDGQPATLLARYRRAKLGIVSRSRRAFLEVFPSGIQVLDLVVVTFVSFMRQRVAIDYYSPV